MITLTGAIATALERGDTVIVPSRQRAHAARIAYAHAVMARGRTAWPTPDVLSLDAWILREVERAGASDDLPRSLSGAEEWWLWREATRDATRDAALAATSALADALRRADRLIEDYRIDLPRWLAVGGSEAQLLDEVRRNVRQMCRSRAVDTAPRLLRERVAPRRDTTVHFVGFRAADAPRALALHESRMASGAAGEWWESAAPRCAPLVEHADDDGDEIGRLAAWCLERCAGRTDARLLVVAAGGIQSREAMAARLRAALAPRSSIEGAVDVDLVAIEGGAPLTRHPLVQHEVATLTWLIDGLEFEEFSAWLRSPYGQPGRQAGARLDLWWRRMGPLAADARASLALFTRAAAQGLEAAAILENRSRAALEALGSGSAGARIWAERFSAALAALRPADSALSSIEQQAWLRFVQLLDEFGALARIAGVLDARRALQTLRDLAARTTWQASTGDALVTIAPTHEDPVAQYDGIWVAGLTADTWPAPPLTDAFIPLPALLEAGVCAATAGGRLATAAANLDSWRASGAELVLSTATASGDMKLAPSPLLAPWPRREASSVAGRWLPYRAGRAIRLERIDDFAGSAWPVANPLPGGSRSLELQALCPFRAYAEQQLDAAPLEAPAPGVAPDERGRWLHRALERFWRETTDSARLAALSPAKVADRAARAVSDTRREVFGAGRSEHDASRTREADRLTGLIAALAEFERQRTPFHIAALEAGRRATIGEAQLRVRIDRIDTLETGGCAVIDYKSGKLPRLDWYGERPTAVQLLVYGAAIGSDVRALVNAGVAPPSPRFSGIAIEKDLLPGAQGLHADSATSAADAWARQRSTWERQLQALVAEFLRGHATVTPAEGACRYCHLATLCRIGEQASLGEEAPEDD
ncbi:MAG: hypothetical protein CMLOHMNK_01164 [Steroidobacteraceae bacterium]|nr:hypothetical protein [Steroidobacteraceae bacterium]